MKKSLLALAVLGAFAGVASAQSSVTLYGTLDLNGRYVKNDGSPRRLSESTDGINSSQLGFKGIEDLGGGLKAGFVLLAGINPDVGSTNGKFFNRRSTVSLMGGFGEVRLGRDYTPTFWNNTLFDAFGTNGVGESNNVKQLTAPNFVRADNAVGYFLPSGIGGVYGQFMAAAGENTAATNGNTAGSNGNPGYTNTYYGPAGLFAGSPQNGRYLGGRVGFASGPFDVAAAYAQETVTLAGDKLKMFNIGGSFDFGVVKLLGYFDQGKLLSAKDNMFSISAVVPLGQGEIHVGGERSKLTTASVSNKVTQFALGYVYNLSKRTAVYATASRLSNGNDTNGLPSLAVSGVGAFGSSGAALPTPGGKSTGAEVGIRHFF